MWCIIFSPFCLSSIQQLYERHALFCHLLQNGNYTSRPYTMMIDILCIHNALLESLSFTCLFVFFETQMIHPGKKFIDINYRMLLKFLFYLCLKKKINFKPHDLRFIFTIQHGFLTFTLFSTFDGVAVLTFSR